MVYDIWFVPVVVPIALPMNPFPPLVSLSSITNHDCPEETAGKVIVPLSMHCTGPPGVTVIVGVDAPGIKSTLKSKVEEGNVTTAFATGGGLRGGTAP